uniref:Uncharacterized protein n=1 Tax=Panagrolaimus sp. PS1159 TaxID=55785 RepID=A0AC35GUG3_9BILA
MVQTITIFVSFSILAIAAVAHVLPFKHSNADAKRTHDPIHICNDIIQSAENYFANQSFTSSQLRHQLEHECIQFSSTDGDEASVACIKMVQNNIEMIFNDVQSQIPSKQICHVTTSVNPERNFTTTTAASKNTFLTTDFPFNVTTNQGWNFTTTNIITESNMTIIPSHQQWNFTSLPTAATNVSSLGKNTFANLLEPLQSAKNVFVFTLN